MWASTLLMHVNLLLALYSGAGLATAARLKWDPTTYVVVREVFPREYRVACGALLAASLLLLALAHLAVGALAARRAARRALLLLYAVCMGALVCGEVWLAAWLGARAGAWLRSAQAQELAELMEVRDHLRPLLHFLGRWHPAPTRLRDLIDEAEADLPRNGHAAMGAAVALLALQVAAFLLALLAARRPPPAATADIADIATPPDSEAEAAPLKTAFSNGRLVLA